MDDKRQAEMDEAICYRVWSGWYDPEEAFDFISDDLSDIDEDELDEAKLRKAVRAEFRKKRAAEKTWPKLTTCDQLDAVFETLRTQGVLTRHRCGLTIQDGSAVVDSLYKEAGGKKSGYIGCCFYHIQDMEGAMEGDFGLCLAFGSYPPSRKGAVQVGQFVRDAFESAGFAVVWDESADTRLLLKAFRWQRRSPKAKK